MTNVPVTLVCFAPPLAPLPLPMSPPLLASPSFPLQLAAELKRAGVLESTLQSAWRSLATLKKELPQASELKKLSSMESLLQGPISLSSRAERSAEGGSAVALEPLFAREHADARGNGSGSGAVSSNTPAPGGDDWRVRSIPSAGDGEKEFSADDTGKGTERYIEHSARDHVSKVLEDAQYYFSSRSKAAKGATSSRHNASASSPPSSPLRSLTGTKKGATPSSVSFAARDHRF